MTPPELAHHLHTAHYYSQEFVDEIDHTDLQALHAVEHSTIKWQHNHTPSAGGP